MALTATIRPDTLDYTRLHITPLTPSLLPAILAPPLLSDARNISYHSLQTFPEKGFGFVDIPIMEAQKLKKKLNGTILRGTKLKIEEARPSKQITASDEAASTPKMDKDKVKKRKREANTLSGVELRDRKVKRGWTEPRSTKKSKEKAGKKESLGSKYISGPECLFRTTLPANMAAAASNEGSNDSKSKGRRLNKSRKDTVIHEFSKTIKHASFLRSKSISPESKPAFEYVEGRGWVDEDGNILDPEVAGKRKNNLKIVIPGEIASKSESVSLHPLEALFKRDPQDSKATEVGDSLPKFSFFGSDAGDDNIDEAVGHVPMTPFTRHEIAHRGIRSAAPTPDTAHPGKAHSQWPTDADSHSDGNGDSDDHGAHSLSDSPSQPLKAEGERQEINAHNAKDSQSEFQKWFYEHRGETSRAWKKRRKMAAKEKRHRDNKKRTVAA